MQNRSFNLDVKELTEQGVFKGIASTSDVDRTSDVILAGALKWDAAKSIPMLWAHEKPIGKYTSVSYTDKGLEVEGEICLATQDGRDAYELMKFGAIGGLSVGILVNNRTVKDGVRYISDAELIEVSITSIPVQQNALITEVKEIETAELDQLAELKAVVEQLRKDVDALAAAELPGTDKSIQNLAELLKSARK